MKQDRLDQLLDGLPPSPGVYIMKDLKGKIVYVGKATSLRSRVRQYFAAGTSDTRFFVRNLADKLSDIEVVLTGSEKEATLLEYNLIQRHRPRFNIRLTDDKRFLCLRLDTKAKWPKVEIVRRPKKDGASYFGPYHSASSARETVKLINRHFKLRSCRDGAFANRVRPCLQYQIKRCFGPCVLDVDPEMYARQVAFVRLFLEGRRDDLLTDLRGRMKEAASQMEYEQAGVLRDQIGAVEQTLAPQRVTAFKDLDQDVLGLHREGELVQVVIMEVVSGRLNGRLDFFFKGVEISEQEVLSTFIVQHYTGNMRIPDEVVVPQFLGDAEVLADILGDEKGAKVRVLFPRRGARVDQIRLANVNAAQIFETRCAEEGGLRARLDALAVKLHLPSPPSRIECVDIAHMGGTNTVGAIGVVVDGKVSRRDGRKYALRGEWGGDDFRAMKEILTRRFSRAQAGDDGWQAPDLMVVDGGRGQLSVAVAVLEELGIANQPVVALAKERAGVDSAATDRVFLVGRMNPIAVRERTSSLQLLALARDEAHRLANKYQADSRTRKTLTSKLDEIPGVGPAMRSALLRRFSSVKKVSAANEAELATVEGVGPRMAKRIKQHFEGRSQENKDETS